MAPTTHHAILPETACVPAQAVSAMATMDTMDTSAVTMPTRTYT